MLIIIAAIIVGALWRRILGGWLGAPRWAVSAAGGGLAGVLAAYAGAPAIAVLLFAASLVWAPGHGSYHDMGTGWPGYDDEWLMPVMRRLFPSRQWFGVAYDFTGMALLYTIMAAASLPALWWAGAGWSSLWMLATGPAVALVYLAGSRVPGWGGRDGPQRPSLGPVDGYTSAGELFSGGLRWGTATAILLAA